MATVASDEEQVVEIVPAAPDPDPEQQQARDVTAPPGYYSDEEDLAAMAAKIKAALSELQRLRARISQLLGPAGPHRVSVATGDYGRRCLAFLEMETSITAAFLTTTSSLQHYLDLETKRWLQDYSLLAIDRVYGVLHEVDPSRHTLLRRASQCFHRRKLYSQYPSKKSTALSVKLYYISERLSCSRYRHLLLTSTSSGLGLITSQLAEAGALLPLVGINCPAKKILRWLALAHQGKMDMNLRVMWIVGPVGIGKTTLAVELRNRIRQYETSRGRYYFQCNVMAQASRGTDRNIRLLQHILSQVSEPAATALSSSDPSQAKTTDVLVRLISECLRDKRYFIIIDDICEASDWEEIKGAFPDTNNLGSRILITTRVTSIAEACCSGFYDGLVHEMKPLDEIDSERLLLAKVVSSVDDCLPDNVKLFCDEILSRCDGIPLFITGMADWLIKEQLLQQQQQHQQRVDHDEEHKKISIYCEGQVPQLPERLEQSLSSAFNNDLPNNELRPLLLYMSMFPYGYKFDKDRLVGKWISEGLVPCLDPETLFSQLVDGNVITSVATNYCKHNTNVNVNEAEACQWQVNHFMHQFLAYKSAEMGFIFTTTTLNIVEASEATAADHGNETSSRMPRRLALHHPDPQLPSLLETMDLSQTRSLSVSGTVSGIPLDKFVNLVLLDLEGWENLKDEDLLHVCRSKMIFLKYLSVRSTRVSKLPREIKELRILKTLDLSYTQINELPLELFELTDLEHLDLRGTQISQLPKQIVGLRRNLVGLFVGSEGSVNSVETAMPHNVRRLYKLQTLATVDLIQHPASFVRALGDLYRLTVLAVTWSFDLSIDRDYCEAFLSSIGKWVKLESLTIHCGLGCSMEFLGSLEKSRAPRRLKKFKVTAGRFASVPPWIDGLKHLAFVQITVCNKQTMTDDLKILGGLPKLQCLILGLDIIPEQAIVINKQGFSKLQRFLVDCPMPWLTFSTGAMPRLTHLQLKFSSGPASEDCVPSGITNLPRISQVVLSYSKWCVNSTSVKMMVKAVREQVAKHRNPIDLFINGVEDDCVQEVDEEAENATGTSWSGADAVPGRDDAQGVNEEATGVAQTEITEAES